MVIDASALLAIILNEPEAERFELAISVDPVRLISPVSALEVSMVASSRLGEPGERLLDSWLIKARVTVVPTDNAQLRWARHGFARFGKGRHPAKLNLGDCFSYALAKATGEPLLFKGTDFPKSDITAAIPQEQ